MTPDQELLGDFTRTGSEAAFATLVQRHLGMVFHAALRRVGGDAHAANDVTQRVFSDLARKAPKLVGHPNLAGWLHRGTRFAAAEFVRGERRRRARELEAQAMNLNDAEAMPEGPLNAVIDEILDSLSEKDRAALVMHFFEGCTFVEVGDALSMTADAARMRVNRALEKTKDLLRRRGISSSAAMLAGALSTTSAFGRSLPSAAGIAHSAISSAGTGSVAATGALRAAMWWGCGLLVTGVAVTTWIRHRPAAEAVQIRSPAAPPLAVASTAPAANSEDADSSAPLSAQPANAAPIAKPSAALTEPSQNALERTMLLRLWIGQVKFEASGGPPDRRFCLRPAQGSPAASCAADLVTGRLAAVGPLGGVIITTKGSSYSLAMTQSEASALVLGPQQSLLLRRLWGGELALSAQHQPAYVHCVLLVTPDSPAADSASGLISKGLAVYKMPGRLMLTLEGMAICQTNFPDLAQQHPPPQG